MASRGHGRVAAAAAALALLPALRVAAAPVAAAEPAVKAAIVYKLTKFVSWPETAFSGPEDGLAICVGSDSPFLAAMKSLNGRSAHGRPIEVRIVPEDRPAGSRCHVLFISAAETHWGDVVLRSAADSPVLTVGEGDTFTAAGGIIALRIEENRIAFVVNLQASERAGLAISAQLLQLATIVQGSGG